MLLVGSRAIKYHRPDFRDPQDWDLIGSSSEIFEWYEDHLPEIASFLPNDRGSKFHCKLLSGTRVELEVSEEVESSRLLTRLPSETASINLGVLDESEVQIPSLSTLLLLKRSHLIFPAHWWKNIQDYHWLKTRVPPDFTENQLHFFRTRRKEVEHRSSKRVNLNMSNDDFFKKSQSSVGRIYDHDSIHTAVSFYGEPLHNRMRPDPLKAATSHRLFRLMSHLDQVRAVQEEAMVIALERILIPALQSSAILAADVVENAYRWAVMRISTTLTAGWFREFAIEHHPEVVALNGYDFVAKFQGNQEGIPNHE